MIAAPDLPTPLLATLAEVVRLTANARQPWCIFAGAAMRLYGATSIEPADIDLLLDPADARAILVAAGIQRTSDGGSGPFRSTVYGTITTAPLPIDVLGGFAVRSNDQWRPVTLQSATQMAFPFGVVQLPSLPELIATTRQLGRPKDLARVRILEALL